MEGGRGREESSETRRERGVGEGRPFDAVAAAERRHGLSVSRDVRSAHRRGDGIEKEFPAMKKPP